MGCAEKKFLSDAEKKSMSDAEKKRGSRSKKPKEYHDLEREASRRRMAIYRAGARAQKRVAQLKGLLSRSSEGEKRDLERLVAARKRRLVVGWFASRELEFDPKMLRETKNVMMKVESRKLELQVAEYGTALYSKLL